MLSILIGLVGLCTAVFREDTGIIDWKLAVYGKPVSVSPHNNYLAAVTSAGVVTVLSPTGVAAWRQILEPHQLHSGIAFLNDTVVLGGDYIEAFNATTGVSLWTLDHPAGQVFSDEKSGKIIVDNKWDLSTAGSLRRLETEVTGKALEVVEATDLGDGNTLHVSHNGVVSLTNSTNHVVWTRDDGLSDAVQAVFIRPEEEENSESESEYLNAAYSSEETSVVQAFVARTSHHIGEVISFGFSLFTGGIAKLIMPEAIKPSYGFHQLLAVRTESGSVYALNTTDDGSIAWVYHDLDPVDLIANHNTVKVVSNDGNTYVLNYQGDIIGVAELPPASPFESIEVDGTQLYSSSFQWQLKLPGDYVVGKAEKPKEDVSALVANPIADDAVMYKYLNPFAAVFASYSDKTQQLVLTVVDAVTGRILAQATNPEPVVISDDWPLQLALGEYWFVYTYMSLDATQVPKITVGELYESEKPNTRVSGDRVDLLADSSTPVLKMASWLAPYAQPVYSLAVSTSPFGAAAREIVLALENTLVTIPKLALSALDPAPKLEIGNHNHLSHIMGVSRARHLVTSNTNLESTYLVAAVGGPDLYVSRSSPSGEIDRLHKQFPKIKLIAFVALLAFVVTSLSPLARLKTLNSQWR